MMDKVTVFHQMVLESLARFEYLTPQQMVHLGLSNNLRFIQSELLNLTRVNTPLIDRIKYSIVVGHGKIPYVYYLTKEGVELLREIVTEETPIKYPSHPRAITSHYYHRCYTIDVMISAYKWVRDKGGDMPLCAAYYGRVLQPNGKRCSPATVSWLEHGTKHTITPDAVIKLRVNDATELHAVEIRNIDQWKPDISKVCQYIKALKAQAVEDTFNYEGQARIVFVYKNDRHMIKLKEWAATNRLFQCSPHKHLFYVAPLEGLQKHSYRKFLFALTG